MSVRIIELHADGIKKLRAVDVQFSDGVNILMGPTQQGKTTLIEVLQLALQGFRKGEARDFIQHGKKTGEFSLTFEMNGRQYRVDRKLKAGHTPETVLKDVTGDGKPVKVGTPQQFLNELIPAVRETPGSFLRKTAAEKLKFILDQHNVGFEDKNKKLEEAKAAKDKLTAQQELFLYAKEPPAQKELVSAGKKKELEDAEAFNTRLKEEYDAKAETLKAEYKKAEAAYTEYKAKLDVFTPEHTKLEKRKSKAEFEKAEITRLEKELEERKAALSKEEKDIKAAEKAITDAEKKLSVVIAPDKNAHTTALEAMSKEMENKKKDTSAISAALKAAEEAEKSAVKYHSDHESYVLKEKEIAEASSLIRSIKDDIKKTLAGIPAKVDGMQVVVDEEDRPDGIYVNGIFSQEWSGAEGFAIAAKILRRYTGQSVLLIDGGESIYNDSKAFYDFCQWAEKDGVQVIMAVVGEQLQRNDDVAGFFVEEGTVRTISLQPEEAADIM